VTAGPKPKVEDYLKETCQIARAIDRSFFQPPVTCRPSNDPGTRSCCPDLCKYERCRVTGDPARTWFQTRPLPSLTFCDISFSHCRHEATASHTIMHHAILPFSPLSGVSPVATARASAYHPHRVPSAAEPSPTISLIRTNGASFVLHRPMGLTMEQLESTHDDTTPRAGCWPATNASQPADSFASSSVQAAHAMMHSLFGILK